MKEIQSISDIAEIGDQKNNTNGIGVEPFKDVFDDAIVLCDRCGELPATIWIETGPRRYFFHHNAKGELEQFFDVEKQNYDALHYCDYMTDDHVCKACFRRMK